jgi:hypothetical protein
MDEWLIEEDLFVLQMKGDLNGIHPYHPWNYQNYL